MARPWTGATEALMAGALRERLPTGCGTRGYLSGHTSRAVKTDTPPRRLIAPLGRRQPANRHGRIR
eukprot:scaffold16716_cov134-Isochrysis_galbana.AAC.1